MTALKIHCRYLSSMDVLEISLLDAECYAEPWSKQDYEDTLYPFPKVATSTAGTVAVVDGETVGAMVYRLAAGRLEVLRFFVHPDWRGLTVGRQMIEHLQAKLHAKRPMLSVVVPETDRGSIAFLRACGLRGAGLAREAYGDRDGFRFEFATPIYAEITL